MSGYTTYDGQRLKAIMDAQGRRQTWLAEQVGVSVGMINHILHGRKPLTATMATKIAKALGVPPLFLNGDIHDGTKSLTDGEAA